MKKCVIFLFLISQIVPTIKAQQIYQKTDPYSELNELLYNLNQVNIDLNDEFLILSVINNKEITSSYNVAFNTLMFKVDYISKNLENLPGTLNKLTEEISSLNLTEKQKFHIYIISSEINRQIEILKSKISTLHREISKINSKQNQIRDALGDVSLQDNNMTSPNTLFGRVNKLFLTSLTLKFNLPDIIYPDQEQ